MEVGKSSWPELVGVDGKENPNVRVGIVKEGMVVTMDFRCDRVRVWVDKHGIVKLPPHIGKKLWPELVGVNGRVAAAKIEKENPNVHAIVLPEGSPATKDLSCDRVQVWVNQHGKVTKIPTIG